MRGLHLHQTSAGLVLLALVALCSADPPKSHVMKLNKDNFAQSTGDGKMYFIKYYAPWCRYCKRMVPKWVELGDTYKDSAAVVVAAVDCTTDEELCVSAKVEAYPTVKLFYLGVDHGEYMGDYEVAPMKEYVETEIQKRALGGSSDPGPGTVAADS